MNDSNVSIGSILRLFLIIIASTYRTPVMKNIKFAKLFNKTKYNRILRIIYSSKFNVRTSIDQGIEYFRNNLEYALWTQHNKNFSTYIKYLRR